MDLHIEIAYPSYLDSQPSLLQAHNDLVLNHIKRKFKLLLGWMISLQSLVIIPRGNVGNRPEEHYSDPFIFELLNWMFRDQYIPPQSLKCLWIPQDYAATRSLSIDHFSTSPFVKSLSLWRDDAFIDKLGHPKFNQMEELFGIQFNNSLAHMTQLKSVVGVCVDDHVILQIMF